MPRESYTPEQIQKKFDALPDDIKTAVYGADMLNLIQTLGEKYKLHVDQVGALEAETADVMTGFSKPEEFAANLSEALVVDKAQAENIAKDVSDQLFVKIRESMKKAAGQAVQAAPAPAVSISKPTVSVPIVLPTVQPPKPDLSAADTMLQTKTVTTPVIKTEPPKPATYSADPYREPPM